MKRALALGGPALGTAAPKVEVCHLNAASDADLPTLNVENPVRSFDLGTLISVAPAAVGSHVAHGDSATPGSGDDQYRVDAAGLAFIATVAADHDLTAWKNADCFITRLADPA